MLPRIIDGIDIIPLAGSVVDDFHPSSDFLIALHGSVHCDPHQGQVGGSERDVKRVSLFIPVDDLTTTDRGLLSPIVMLRGSY